MASSQDNPMANGNGRTMALNNILHPGNDNLAFTSDNDKNKQLARTESALSEEGFNPNLDHSDHDLFVQMDELEEHTWIERSRWIKYEEVLEPETGEWSNAHVSNLSFQSMIGLRLCLENVALMLDVEAKGFPDVVERVVHRMAEQHSLNEKVAGQIQLVLGYRHKHVTKNGLMSKTESLAFLSNNKLAHMSGKEQTVMEMPGVGTPNTARKAGILSCLNLGTEGSISLVGALPEISKPAVALVRLAKAVMMPKTTEVSLPVRFIFIAFTPSSDMDLDHHEIGRSMSTLMADKNFHNIAYHAREKADLLKGVNEFLDESVLLPPGDWDRRNLLPMAQILNMRRRIKERKQEKVGARPTEKKAPPRLGAMGRPVRPPRNPLSRTSTPFGGLLGDIKQRYPQYLEDIKDGLNSQTVAATIFIYFACLSGAIAFGGLMGESTEGAVGISETIILSAFGGLVFALFSGCPLIITGVTGPVLLYDQALFDFSKGTLPGQFLPWRLWIGIWTFIISLVVAFFQGSTLVRYFTRFTKDIFNALVALLFIVSAFKKLGKIFSKHPLTSVFGYCASLPEIDTCLEDIRSQTNDSTDLWTITGAPFYSNITGETSCSLPDPVTGQPNTALLSMFFMLGTFFIAYFLRIMRTSHYMGKNARKAMGDFGVPIAIVIMVGVSFAAQDTYTEKLLVPEGLQVTNSTLRGWVIPALGFEGAPLEIWAIFAAILPALLLYLLLFMETHICELIMMERTKGVKGVGVHLDIVLLSLINLICGVFGGPWICAATVRACSHVSALTVMSTSSKPGEPLKAIGVRDQRVSAAVVSILLGLSILMSPILKYVPFAVLFGVFLYMGISGMNGVQFFDRVFLGFQHKKHHPNVSYVQNVKTWRMILFTVLQALGLAVLWTVKEIKAIALAFPFFVVMMIPYRSSLKFIFTEMELDMLDGAQAGKNLSGEVDEEKEEKDFYAAAADCPVVPEMGAMGLIGGMHQMFQAHQKIVGH